jgi:hypothetical protein
MTDKLKNMRVAQTSNATRGVWADVELTLEPRPRQDLQGEGTCWVPFTVRAQSVDNDGFGEPRFFIGDDNRFTREDWDRLDRVARRLFDEYDRTFPPPAAEAARREMQARPTEPSPAERVDAPPSVAVQLDGVLLVREENVSARTLRGVLDRLFERLGARRVSVVLTSQEPL